MHATLSLVPTPSMDATRTGWRYFEISRAKKPPNLPISVSTPGVNVVLTMRLMRSTASSPASILTPASLYPIFFIRPFLIHKFFPHASEEDDRQIGLVIRKCPGLKVKPVLTELKLYITVNPV